MNSVLNKMLALLSEEDKNLFEGLSDRLKKVNGDIKLLSEEDILLINKMEAEYGDSINKTHKEDSQDISQEEFLNTPFAHYVRQTLARDLGNKFPQEEEAINFAFNQKWLPIDCQDESLSKDLYQKFSDDINEANQWRKDMLDINSDKKMAVGLAWFMVVFQLHQRFCS